MNAILETLESKYGPSRLVEIGKIKVGSLGQSRQSNSGATWRVPQKQDHFTVTGLARNQAGDLVADEDLMHELAAEYGDKDGKLRRIPMRLLSDEPDDVLQAAFVFYGKSSCGARSDGETVTWFYDPQTFQPLDTPRTEPWNAALLERTIGSGNKSRPMFKLHAQLNCVIASKHARWGGVYKFRTTSVISYRQLHSGLRHIHQLTGGVLMGMPLQLVVRPQTVHPDGKATTVYVVHVELIGAELAEIQKLALEQARYRLEFKERIETVQAEYRRLLIAPGQERNGEIEDIAAEFAPEAEEPLPDAADNYSLLDDEAPCEPNGTVSVVGSDPLQDWTDEDEKTFHESKTQKQSGLF